MGLDFEKAIDFYYGTYKKGLLGAKDKINLFIYPSSIEGIAYNFNASGDKIGKSSNSFSIKMSDIINISYGEFSEDKGIIIEYRQETIITSSTKFLLLPGIQDYSRWLQLIVKSKEKFDDKEKHDDLCKKMNDEANKNLHEKKEEEAKQFYDNCYKFHIQQDTPIYELFNDKSKIALIYVGNDRSLNFLKIDGYSKEESNAIIPFEKIHYYEKAGTIHYVANIHGDYSSFGGSMTGGKFSKLAAIGGGLLFGLMGMTAGALLTYKPAKLNEATTNFHIESEAERIDERSVILNFYSDLKKQYVDIELPQEIYNFFQTYFAEKKHYIVMELESKTAALQAKEQIENGSILINTNEIKKIEAPSECDEMSEFKKKIDKLVMLREAGLLSEEEFNIEKSKLIKEI